MCCHPKLFVVISAISSQPSSVLLSSKTFWIFFSKSISEYRWCRLSYVWHRNIALCRFNRGSQPRPISTLLLSGTGAVRIGGQLWPACIALSFSIFSICWRIARSVLCFRIFVCISKEFGHVFHGEKLTVSTFLF